MKGIIGSVLLLLCLTLATQCTSAPTEDKWDIDDLICPWDDIDCPDDHEIDPVTCKCVKMTDDREIDIDTDMDTSNNDNGDMDNGEMDNMGDSGDEEEGERKRRSISYGGYKRRGYGHRRGYGGYGYRKGYGGYRRKGYGGYRRKGGYRYGGYRRKGGYGYGGYRRKY